MSKTGRSSRTWAARSSHARPLTDHHVADHRSCFHLPWHHRDAPRNHRMNGKTWMVTISAFKWAPPCARLRVLMGVIPSLQQTSVAPAVKRAADGLVSGFIAPAGRRSARRGQERAIGRSMKRHPVAWRARSMFFNSRWECCRAAAGRQLSWDGAATREGYMQVVRRWPGQITFDRVAEALPLICPQGHVDGGLATNLLLTRCPVSPPRPSADGD